MGRRDRLWWALWWGYAVAWSAALLTTFPLLARDTIVPAEFAFGAGKVLHVMAYAAFALLTSRLPTWRRTFLLVVVLHGPLTEFLQQFTGRSGLLWDVGLDWLGVTLGVLIEVDVGMKRCGVQPGEEALALARQVQRNPGLHFLGLQGYQGHLQMIANPDERRAKCHEGLRALLGTRSLLEEAGIPVAVVTGGGTGTWEDVGFFEGMTELQPGSFVLMDAMYHKAQPAFHCALSILCTVISRRPECTRRMALSTSV